MSNHTTPSSSGRGTRTDVNVRAILAKPTESRLVRLSGLCTDSTGVHPRADMVGKTSLH